MMCPDCGGCVPDKKCSCTKCNKMMDPSLIKSYSNLKKRLLEEYKDDLETYENLFAEAVTIFHPNDRDYLDLLEVLYEKRLAVQNYPGKYYTYCVKSHFSSTQNFKKINTYI